LISSGIVVTDGASQVGLCGFGRICFQMPVRLGLPQHVSGLIDVRQNPAAVGLLLYGLQQQNTTQSFVLERRYLICGCARNWFQGNF
jgi:cell division protein FtsA